VNMLMWHRRPWLIDHGAALYFHHAWSSRSQPATQPFALIKDHVLLKFASMLEDLDAGLAARLSADKIAEIVALIPDAWLAEDPGFDSKAQQREAYLDFFKLRLRCSNQFVREAVHARTLHL
ncbi:MAG: aminotransferase class I and II, partial [Steroidobacteraceae bacterium]